MNRSERVLVSQLILEVREAGLVSDAADRLGKLIAAQERPSTPRKSVRRWAGDSPALVAGKAAVQQRSNGLCEARIDGVCSGQATETHHRAGRSGDGSHHPVLLVHVCGHGNMTGCHGAIETHPDWARRHGYKLWRGTDYDDAPATFPGCPLTCPETHI